MLLKFLIRFGYRFVCLQDLAYDPTVYGLDPCRYQGNQGTMPWPSSSFLRFQTENCQVISPLSMFSNLLPIGDALLSLGVSFCLDAVNEAPRSPAIQQDRVL